jgi:hypothetical protein
VIWVGNYNHQALLCRWKVRQRLITLSNLPKNSAHIHVLSSRAHFTLRGAYILELICAILREPSGIVTYLKRFETCFLSFSAYILPLLPLLLSSFRLLFLFLSLFFIYAHQRFFNLSFFFLYVSFYVLHFLLPLFCLSLSLSKICAVGCNTSIHLLRFKSVRAYQRDRHCTEQTDAGSWLCVTDLCPKYVLHFRRSSAGVATKLSVRRPKKWG